MLGQLKEEGLFYQQSPFSRGLSCKSLQATKKWMDRVYFTGFNFSYIDSYLAPIKEPERISEETLVRRLNSKICSVLSMVFGLNYLPNAKYSTHTDRVICAYNNASTKISPSQLIADTMYITIMTKPERLFRLIREFAPPELEDSKYLGEIVAYIEYVINSDVELKEELVRDFVHTLIELNK